MRAPEEINHFQYDEDGLLQHPLAAVAWDPSWDVYGEQPLPGLDVFEPVSPEATTPHDGDGGIDKATYHLLISWRQRRAGWCMLWLAEHRVCS